MKKHFYTKNVFAKNKKKMSKEHMYYIQIYIHIIQMYVPKMHLFNTFFH